MNILIIAPQSIIIPTQGYGGTQRVCINLLKGLQSLGQTVLLAGPKGSGAQDLPIIESGTPPTKENTSSSLNTYIQSIRERCPWTPDIIHNHSDAVDQINQHFPGIPLVTTIHGHNETLPTQGHLIFISQSQKSQYHVHGPNIHQIYNPINLSEFTYQETKQNYLIFMAKLNWKVKGVATAIKVAKATQTPLYLCGPGMNWKLRLKLSPLIQYKGEVSGTYKTQLLANAKALLYPTQWPEPFGLAPAEANACGTPAIVLGNGAMPEVVKDKISGFICSTETHLISAITHLSQISPKNCRKWVQDQFDHIKIASDHLRLFQQLIF